MVMWFLYDTFGPRQRDTRPRLRFCQSPHSFAGNLFATEGQHIALAGRWETHAGYGRQFIKVAHVEIEMPSGAEGLAQFIANHPEVKGIGPRGRRRLSTGANAARRGKT